MSSDPTEGPTLKSLGGKTVKRAMVLDLQRLNLLPAEALPHLYRALGPLLGHELSRERFDKVVGPYAEQFRIPMSDLVSGFAAARMLLRGAAAEELVLPDFVDDLEVCGIDVPVAKVLAEGYGQALVMIRGELTMAALMDHGAVLKHVDWRLDQLRASSRAKNLNAPVVTLTLHYRDAGEDRRLSLQAIPPVLKALRATLDELLEDDAEAAPPDVVARPEPPAAPDAP
ncbi:MAG: COMM domain-containing protein [Myxococcota bacterium]